MSVLIVGLMALHNASPSILAVSDDVPRLPVDQIEISGEVEEKRIRARLKIQKDGADQHLKISATVEGWEPNAVMVDSENIDDRLLRDTLVSARLGEHSLVRVTIPTSGARNCFTNDPGYDRLIISFRSDDVPSAHHWTVENCELSIRAVKVLSPVD